LKVNDVAKRLNFLPRNLNSGLKKATGLSTSELLADQVLLEAKRYLLHTDKPLVKSHLHCIL
jgi:AraC-like DNA-binding protein